MTSRSKKLFVLQRVWQHSMWGHSMWSHSMWSPTTRAPHSLSYLLLINATAEGKTDSRMFRFPGWGGD